MKRREEGQESSEGEEEEISICRYVGREILRDEN